MIVKIDGNQYRIGFQYGITHNHHHYEGIPLRYTQCDIFLLDAIGPWMKSGWAFCGPSDAFVKETGRKLALQRALKKAGFTRDQRRQVWEQYFQYTSSRPASPVAVAS